MQGSGALDSHHIHTQFLFDHIDTGSGFVRKAQKHTDPAKRATVLSFARSAYATVLRLSAVTPLSDEELDRLDEALAALRSEIEASSRGLPS